MDGRRQHFCCADCALWEHRQTGATVEITEVTDYISGTALNASDAVVVVGSQVNLCLRQHSVFDQHPTVHDQSKAPGSLEFDGHDTETGDFVLRDFCPHDRLEERRPGHPEVALELLVRLSKSSRRPKTSVEIVVSLRFSVRPSLVAATMYLSRE